MDVLTKVSLELAVAVLRAVEEIEICASRVGLMRSETTKNEPGFSLTVYRPGNECDEISEGVELAKALPLFIGDELTLALDDVSGGRFNRLFLTLKFAAVNEVGELILQSKVYPSVERDEYFDVGMKQYWFAKLLHQRLNASVTKCVFADDDKCVYYSFASDGQQKLIPDYEKEFRQN